MDFSLTPEQRERRLPELVKNPRALLATADTGPLFGSDNIPPCDAPGVGTQATTARSFIRRTVGAAERPFLERP
ncbi:MAG: hypothetical protein ACE5JS_10175 [Nitrospinota bacterium]